MRAREAAAARTPISSLRWGGGVVVIACMRIWGEPPRGVVRAADSLSSQGLVLGAVCVIAHTPVRRLPAPALADVDLALDLRAPRAVLLAGAGAVEGLLRLAADRARDLSVGVDLPAQPEDGDAALGVALAVEAVEVELGAHAEAERAVLARLLGLEREARRLGAAERVDGHPAAHADAALDADRALAVLAAVSAAAADRVVERGADAPQAGRVAQVDGVRVDVGVEVAGRALEEARVLGGEAAGGRVVVAQAEADQAAGRVGQAAGVADRQPERRIA